MSTVWPLSFRFTLDIVLVTVPIAAIEYPIAGSLGEEGLSWLLALRGQTVHMVGKCSGGGLRQLAAHFTSTVRKQETEGWNSACFLFSFILVLPTNDTVYIHRESLKVKISGNTVINTAKAVFP